MSNEAAKTTSNNPFDILIVGLKKGLNIGLYSLLPNVVMAFVLTYILQLWGVMDFLGRTCGGIMGIFDLPGQAITVLLATWMSCGAGVERRSQRSRRHDSGTRFDPDGLSDSVHGSTPRRGGCSQEVLAAVDAQQSVDGLHRYDLDAVFRLSSRNADKATGQTAACPRRSFEIRGFTRLRRAPSFLSFKRFDDFVTLYQSAETIIKVNGPRF